MSPMHYATIRDDTGAVKALAWSAQMNAAIDQELRDRRQREEMERRRPGRKSEGFN